MMGMIEFMKPQDAVKGLHNFYKLPQKLIPPTPPPGVFRRGYVNIEKVFSCFYEIFLLKIIRENLKRHNHIYILLSKHSYRPMRVCILAQLFYNIPCNIYLWYWTGTNLQQWLMQGSISATSALTSVAR